MREAAVFYIRADEKKPIKDKVIPLQKFSTNASIEKDCDSIYVNAANKHIEAWGAERPHDVIISKWHAEQLFAAMYAQNIESMFIDMSDEKLSEINVTYFKGNDRVEVEESLGAEVCAMGLLSRMPDVYLFELTIRHGKQQCIVARHTGPVADLHALSGKQKRLIHQFIMLLESEKKRFDGMRIFFNKRTNKRYADLNKPKFVAFRGFT